MRYESMTVQSGIGHTNRQLGSSDRQVADCFAPCILAYWPEIILLPCIHTALSSMSRPARSLRLWCAGGNALLPHRFDGVVLYLTSHLKQKKNFHPSRKMDPLGFYIEAVAAVGSPCWFLFAYLHDGSLPPTAENQLSTSQRRLVQAQTLGMVAVFALTALGLRPPAGENDGDQQPSATLKSIPLFGSLIWLAFGLLLHDAKQVADRKHHNAWAWSTTLYAMSMWLTESASCIQSIRLAILVGLLASALTSRRHNNRTEKEKTPVSDDSHTGLPRQSWSRYAALVGVFARYLRPRTTRQGVDAVVVILSTLVMRATLLAQPLAVRALVDDVNHDWTAKAILCLGLPELSKVMWKVRYFCKERLQTWLETNLEEQAVSHALGLQPIFTWRNRLQKRWRRSALPGWWWKWRSRYHVICYRIHWI